MARVIQPCLLYAFHKGVNMVVRLASALAALDNTTQDIQVGSKLFTF